MPVFQMRSIILLYQPLTTLRCYQLFVKKLARGKDTDFWGNREGVKVAARIHVGRMCSSINKWYLYHVWSFGNSLHWCKKQWLLMQGYFFCSWRQIESDFWKLKFFKSLQILIKTFYICENFDISQPHLWSRWHWSNPEMSATINIALITITNLLSSHCNKTGVLNIWKNNCRCN